MNRGIVIHGTNGLELKNNILYDIRGHGFFTEDAVERRNIIDGNLVLHVRNPFPNSFALKIHEAGTNANRGSSGFWISNPDNIVVNNAAADCETNGIWLTFPVHPWGLHQNFPLRPDRLLFGVFKNNTVHSNRKEGLMLDFAEISNAGDIFPHQYLSTSDGQDPVPPLYPTVKRFSIEGINTWKNGAHGFWDRSAAVDNFEIISADNCGRFFAGSGAAGVIERSMVICTSLNHLMNGTDRPTNIGEIVPAGFATYHSAFAIRENIVIDCPEESGEKSGVFATEDYYLFPAEKGQIKNNDNLIINSHPGVKLMAPFSYFALAGALWDPHGTWGGTPGDWFVFDTPFYTYGQTPTIVPPGNASGGVLVEGPFYGLTDYVVNQANDRNGDFMELKITRLNNNLDSVGTWEIGEGGPGLALSHMRHFAAHPDGYYTVEFPDISLINDIGLALHNFLSAEDSLVVGIEYSGEFAVSQVFTSTFYNYFDTGHTNGGASGIKHIYTQVDSLQAVINSTGETYWQDTINNKVWVKIKGGIDQLWDPDDYDQHSPELLYWRMYLRIWGEAIEVPMNVFLEGPYDAVNGNMSHDLSGISPSHRPAIYCIGFSAQWGGGF